MANYPVTATGELGTLAGAETVTANDTILLANTCESAIRVTIRIGTTNRDTITIDGNGCYEYVAPAGGAVTLVNGRTTHGTRTGARSHRNRADGNTNFGHVIFNGEGSLRS